MKSKEAVEKRLALLKAQRAIVLTDDLAWDGFKSAMYLVIKNIEWVLSDED